MPLTGIYLVRLGPAPRADRARMAWESAWPARPLPPVPGRHPGSPRPRPGDARPRRNTSSALLQRTCRRHSHAFQRSCWRISPAIFAASASGDFSRPDFDPESADRRRHDLLAHVVAAAHRAFDQLLLALRVIGRRVREPGLELMLPHTGERIADQVSSPFLSQAAAVSASSASSWPARSRSKMSSEPPTWRPLMKICG